MTDHAPSVVAPGLREALKPFAEFADPNEIVPPAHVITQGSSMARRQLTMGDCYKARAALRAESVAAPARELDRLADMALMSAGEVMTGNDYTRYHKAIRERFRARLVRAAEYAALAAAPPALDAAPERWWATRWVAQFKSDGSGREAAAEMTRRANELGAATPASGEPAAPREEQP